MKKGIVLIVSVACVNLYLPVLAATQVDSCAKIVIIPSTGQEIASSPIPKTVEIPPTDLPQIIPNRRYADEFGLGRLFAYDEGQDADEFGLGRLFAHYDDGSDLSLLQALGDYRKKHLDNHNPLLVRFRVKTNQGMFQITTGLFVSGVDNDYRGQHGKQQKTDLTPEQFMYTSIELDKKGMKSKYIGIISSEDTTLPQNLKDVRKDFLKEVEQALEPEFEKYYEIARKILKDKSKEFRDINIESTKEYLFETQIGISHRPYGVYRIPAFEGSYAPVTLIRLYAFYDEKTGAMTQAPALTDKKDLRLAKVAGRIFGCNLFGAASGRTPPLHNLRQVHVILKHRTDGNNIVS